MGYLQEMQRSKIKESKNLKALISPPFPLFSSWELQFAWWTMAKQLPPVLNEEEDGACTLREVS